MVLEAFRSRGVGAHMLTEMERRARVAGCQQLTLKVKSADAERFYLRHGYLPQEQQGEYRWMVKSFKAI
jgi:GNAT superfamily N-acetyltransferase